MSKLITRINGVRLEVDGPRADGYLHFGDYRSAPDELSTVMVFAELDTALTARVSTDMLIEYGSQAVTLADLEYVAKGTVNGKRIAIIECPPCLMCGKTATVYMPWDAFNNWRNNGNPIQLAWSEAHQSTRELLVSGTHAKCWNELAPEEEED